MEQNFDLFQYLQPAAGEVTLALLAMALLIYGLSSLRTTFVSVRTLGIGVLAVTGVVLIKQFDGASVGFDGLFVHDYFSLTIKVLLCLAGAFALLLSQKYYEVIKPAPFEYTVLICLSIVGMFLMVSSNNFMTLYLALELQSLPLYVLASFRREDRLSTEAGLKYFSLGALSSGFLLYGISLIYGSMGSVSFPQIQEYLLQNAVGVPEIIGIVFILCGLAFKISAVPFHMWTPDVYQGAPTPVTAFFATAPKLAAIALMVRVFYGVFGSAVDVWQQVMIALSVGSMTIGAFGAIWQQNIKRLLAYSSIGHMGYALVAFATGKAVGLEALLFYIMIYLVMSVGVFALVLLLRNKDIWHEALDELGGLSKTSPYLALAMAVLMLSLAGIPPFAGFLGKLMVFKAAVDANLTWLAVYGLLMSVVSAYYYLRVIKIMYFDAPVLEHVAQKPDISLTIPVGMGVFASAALILSPDWLIEIATLAANGLY